MEVLAERLLWERTANGIRVIIPAPRNWRILPVALWFAIWTFAGLAALRQTTRSPASLKGHLWVVLWLLLAWVAGELFVAAGILWSLGGETQLQLDPTSLQIEGTLFGCRLNRRSLPVSKIRNLRYTPPNTNLRGGVPSRISFESGKKKLTFASGVSEIEASALIGKMAEVHPFSSKKAHH